MKRTVTDPRHARAQRLCDRMRNLIMRELLAAPTAERKMMAIAAAGVACGAAAGQLTIEAGQPPSPDGPRLEEINEVFTLIATSLGFAVEPTPPDRRTVN